MVSSEPEEEVGAKTEPTTTTATATTTAAATATAAAPAKDDSPKDEISKRYYRLDVLSKMRTEKRSQSSGPSNSSSRKIPFFQEAEQAAERLAETEEFKKANKIKVNIDLAQEAVKLQVLKANKTLFVAPSQKSEYLYAKIKPCDTNEIPIAQQKRIVKMLGAEDTFEELGLDQSEPLDMIIVGCVAVSEQGQRIGKGNGYVDLEIALLTEQGVITPQTVIATTVADAQVYESLPREIFKPYDFTVDLIVTPTRVIRVANRPAHRVIGIQWGLLSARRLEVVRVLKKLKEQLEAQGKVIVLKEEDTDVESFRKSRNQRGSGGAAGGGGGNGTGQRRQQTRRRRSVRNQQQQNGGSDGEGGGSQDEGGAGRRSGEGGVARRRPGGGNNRVRNRSTKQQDLKDFPDSADSKFNGGRRGKRTRRRGEGGGATSGGGPSDDGGDQQFDNGGGGQRNEKARGGGAAGAGGGGDGGERRKRRTGVSAQLRQQGSVRIRVSNMFAVRYKDFKEELRCRDCYPFKISKGRYGKCVLIFLKRDNVDEESQVNELLGKLADLRLTVQLKDGESKEVELKCDVPQSRRDGSLTDQDDPDNLDSPPQPDQPQKQPAPDQTQSDHSDRYQKVS
ncbi:protein FAM98B [Anopheles aquasalis]|uniref:protein FAM98B n=1 Tax=Anopheles aquasalis TaxID=42839 RepID=UPI00215B66B4|nr:protein FAM98B [Anopheles aquasalis]XP_050099468.1 protein FAM98B [Anopheles aquasalis]